ncbi:MAG TPA: hypothetical protein VFO38_06495 [Candidatus Saccharimonadales bacterium]|nr:hypothetical protein [Candidatus Saccharimonadales bacterium]
MSWPLRGVVAAAIGIMLITHQVYLLTMGVANVFAGLIATVVLVGGAASGVISCWTPNELNRPAAKRAAALFAIVLVVLGGFMQLMSWLFGPQLT